MRSACARCRAISPIATRCVACRAAACDAVFHNAAKAGAWGSYESYHQANVVGTQNVLDACRAHGIGKLVYTSTPSVTHRATHPVEGGTADTVPYGEGFKAPYATTKTIAEKAVLAANDAAPRHGRAAPAPDLGPRRQPAAAATGRARAGRPPALRRRRRQPHRHHLHRQRRAGALRRLRRTSRPGAACAGKAYFISNGEPMAVREIVNALLRAAGAPQVDKTIPFGVAYAVGAVCEAPVDACCR